ncbi:Oidioi.mRNA.OKI2018_I69.PAR.g10784.t1.cds [Oikopleura dioica]|uniref:U5 small nuclear ribonucleoprotein TSSC4 n=1 Tax=Oikopleura dioica TaxID=34765 RepID=A0ABN7RXK1_OIKDI|nr:Oidioi.mRNA.OKI2018_I69.PAR.g10784.t1.cds [Oikopleura dioica]
MADTETKSSEYNSKKSALESAFDAAISSGSKTRLGVREAPSLEELDRFSKKECRSIKEHQFERPNSRPCRKRRAPRIPSHIKNPEKFKKYDLSDVSLSSSQDNKKAALSFLAEMRDRKEPKEDPYDEERDGKLVFKKPTLSSKNKSKSTSKSKTSKTSDRQGAEITHFEHDWREELEAKAASSLVEKSIESNETPEKTTFAKKTRRKNIRKRTESDDE